MSTHTLILQQPDLPRLASVTGQYIPDSSLFYQMFLYIAPDLVWSLILYRILTAILPDLAKSSLSQLEKWLQPVATQTPSGYQIAATDYNRRKSKLGCGPRQRE